MGIEAAVISAGIGAGASLYGSKRNRDSQRRSADQANMMAEARTNRALAGLQPGFEQAMQSQQFGYDESNRMNQEALEQAMMMRGNTFMPQMQAFEGGNLAAQEANLASLPAMRAAILGGRMPDMMQPRSLPIDMQALDFLINPQAQQFRRMPNQQMPNQQMMANMQQMPRGQQMSRGGMFEDERAQMQFNRVPADMR